ncbi:ATP-binding cassette domain-containing protein [uncultured Polaribacter sp.]|uniref:ATP-binding cassette domain-containing protein n=1 Tax=uncultured Polaribacter sp. TaxID=174711 RepID=UPI002635EFF9|nr:ATP-binding cassette domain-containing protein [uncultured Polaribacter sp.]
MDKIHYAIKKGDLSVKNDLINDILNGNHSLSILQNKKGLLFSDSILEKIINQEVRYSTKIIKTPGNRSIRSFSSGEQKKLVLNYLIEKNPSFLILDCPFESLDISSISSIKQKLINLSLEIPIIQLFNRKEEILPIISHILEVANDKITSFTEIENYNFKEYKVVFKGNIPQAITKYENIPNQLIKLKNVSVNYENNYVLKNINWRVNKNEFWQLIGPNGSGKTTILSMIYGNNVKAFGQEVYLFGNKKGSGESVWEIKEKIGYFSPTMLDLFKTKTTLKEMIISGFFDSIGLYQKPSSLQEKLAEDWLKLLGFEHKKNVFFNNISVVSQRLILIARAIIKHPPLLILDEPLINLDNHGTTTIITLINKLVKESETTIIYVSHRVVNTLQTSYNFKLIPSENGSLGKIIN